MATKNRIGLRLPDQSPPQEKSFFLNDKEVQEWVKALPVANIGETSRQLFQTIRAFNRTQMPYKKRLLSAEQFRQPVSYVASNLNKHFVDVGFPLSDKAYKIAILNRELHSGLATAYKCVASDLLLEQHSNPDQKSLIIAIHRALSYLSRILLLSALIYESYPKRTWRELHVLHRLACRYNIESSPVDDPFDEHDQSSTIDEAYRRCVLFALASPYKMRQRDNIELFDALLDWSKLCHFHPIDQASSENTILIQQDSDFAPRHESLTVDADSGRLLKMDVTQLIDRLHRQFEKQAEKESLQGIERFDQHLLRHLIKFWNAKQKRSFVRTKLNIEIRIAVGLSNIYQLIEESQDKQQEEPAEAQRTTDSPWLGRTGAYENVLDISSRFTLEPIETHQHDENSRGNFEEFGPDSQDYREPEPDTPIWDQTDTQHKPDYTSLLRTLNESAGGYCLAWKGSGLPKVQVGELIGIQSAMVNNQIGVGIVRWLKNSVDEKLHVGLEMTAPNAIAVVAQKDKQPGTRTHECLLLPEVGTSGQPTSLISPSYPFTVGDLLRIDDYQSSREIKLTRLLESSGAISQFQFKYLDQPELQGDEADSEEIDDDSEFDNLWTTL